MKNARINICTKFSVLVWTDDKAGYIVPLLPIVCEAKKSPTKQKKVQEKSEIKRKMPESICTKFNVLVWTDDKAGYIVLVAIVLGGGLDLSLYQIF